MCYLNVPTAAEAAQTVTSVDFNYDPALYDINVGETIYLEVFSKDGWLMNTGAVFTGTSVKSTMSLVRIELVPIFYTSKHTINGYYFQAMGYKLDSTGQDPLSGYKGYPYEIDVKVGAVGAFDTMMTSYDIQPRVSSGVTSYSIDGASIGGEVGWSAKDGWGAKGTANFQITNSRSWTAGCIEISPQKNNASRAVWEYYFTPSKKVKADNIQCYSTNSFNGLISWKVKPGYSLVGGFDINIAATAGIVQKNGTKIGQYSSTWVGNYSTYQFGSASNHGTISYRR